NNRNQCDHGKFSIANWHCQSNNRAEQCPTPFLRGYIWSGRGDLNPHAFRRHPLKMVCLPVPPLPHVTNVINNLPRIGVRGVFLSAPDYAPIFCILHEFPAAEPSLNWGFEARRSPRRLPQIPARKARTTARGRGRTAPHRSAMNAVRTK